jgi:hypothetical protein|nr:metal-dependent hydrolase [Asticcacaulis taihuensis]
MARWWMGNDPVGTAVMKALSITFPEGERFFIQSVMRYAADLPPQVERDVKPSPCRKGHILSSTLTSTAASARRDMVGYGSIRDCIAA